MTGTKSAENVVKEFVTEGVFFHDLYLYHLASAANLAIKCIDGDIRRIIILLRINIYLLFNDFSI